MEEFISHWALATGVDKNPFSLCSEPMRILRTELNGFMLCLLEQEPQTWLRRGWMQNQEIWFPGQHTRALLRDPGQILSMLLSFSPSPWKKKKKWVMIPMHTASWGVSWKTNELMNLQEHDAIWGTIQTETFMILPIVWFSLGLFLAWPESICERQTHRHAQTHTWNRFPVSSTQSSVLDLEAEKTVAL